MRVTSDGKPCESLRLAFALGGHTVVRGGEIRISTIVELMREFPIGRVEFCNCVLDAEGWTPEEVDRALGLPPGTCASGSSGMFGGPNE
jgi:hypothetical protein